MKRRININTTKITNTLTKCAVLLFMLFMAIFTTVVSVSNVDAMLRTAERRKDVEPKIAELEAKIERDSSFIHNLQHSPDFLEEFARERFRMQRETDIVYIIEE